MPYFGTGTGNNACKWTYSGGYHTIRIPGYNFQRVVDLYPNSTYKSQIQQRIISSDTIKIPDANTDTIVNQHAPIVFDVRHNGSKQEQYQACNYYGKLIGGGPTGGDLFGQRNSKCIGPHPLIPLNNDANHTYMPYSHYNDEFDQLDSDSNSLVARVTSIINDPDPNGVDQTETIKLYNYDAEKDMIHIRWNTKIIFTPGDIGGGETIMDVFAVRARFCLNYLPTVSDEEQRWSNWFYDFSPDGYWDDGPNTMVLYGNIDHYKLGTSSPLASDSNNWYGFGSERNLRNAYIENKKIKDSGICYIPPNYPYAIKVEVQVANMCGVGSAKNNTVNVIATAGRQKLNNAGNGYELDDEYYYRIPDRSIYVSPSVDTFNVPQTKSFIDYALLRVEPPSGCSIDFSELKGVTTDANGNTTWFGSTATSFLKVRELIIYAKEKDNANAEYVKVFNWKAKEILSGNNKLVKQNGSIDSENTNPKDLYESFISRKNIYLAKQDPNNENTKPLEDDNRLINARINSKIFKPGTAYNLKIYYRVELNYSKNKFYREYCSVGFDGRKPNTEYTNSGYGWNLKHILIRRRYETMTIKTLPISKIFTYDKDVDTGAITNYEYIFGRSQLGNYPMEFRVERQIKRADANTIVASTDSNKAKWWEYNYDQQVTMRVTLTATKGSNKVAIQKTLVKTKPGQGTSTYNDPKNNSSDPRPNAADKYDGIVFTKSQYIGYKNYLPKIYLNQKQWDDLYKLYPSYGAANLNQISVKVSIESQGTYKDDDGNPIWYKNTGDDRTITLQLTGIEPTSHVKDAGNGQTFRRARIWVKDANNGQTFKRAVAWVKDKNNGQSFKRSI